MDLWQLKIFCKVIELKSFSRAALAVHLSQPTVSSHIKELEAHCGCRLIDRLAKKSVPTAAGKLLYRYAHRLIALHDEAESALAEFNGRIRGRLVVGGSTIPGGYLLPRIVGAFARQYPEVVVSLVIADTAQIASDILAGALELGLVGARVDHRQLLQQKLVEDEMCLIVPANHAWANKKTVSLAELFSEPFIIREHGSGTLKSLQDSLHSHGRSIDDFKIAAQMGSTEAVCQAIKSDVGISILSTLAVSDELKDGSLKALTVRGLNLKRNFYLTRHKNRSSSPLARAFIKFLNQSHGKTRAQP